mgnify:CR=1 FL=1
MKIVQCKILGFVFFRYFVPFCLHYFSAHAESAEQHDQLQQNVKKGEKCLICGLIGEKEDPFAHDAERCKTCGDHSSHGQNGNAFLIVVLAHLAPVRSELCKRPDNACRRHHFAEIGEQNVKAVLHSRRGNASARDDRERQRRRHDPYGALAAAQRFLAAAADKDAAVIYIFDSNSYSHKEVAKGYDWIKRDQINWYVDKSREFTEANGGNALPSLAFFHIPLPEFNEAASDEDARLIGTRREKACAPVVNSGLFTAMLECGDVMGVFVGHDHVNDYAVEWKGIMLCYGRFTGSKNTYWDIPGGNGARVIELEEGKRGFRSWIRMNDGRTINEFSFPEDYVKH